ncbi:MAG: alpha/beta hydrolase, partial [Planctomycetes bacterium]|nr:alpha/beta hydrolase [Planctomycetota bacterium]
MSTPATLEFRFPPEPALVARPSPGVHRRWVVESESVEGTAELVFVHGLCEHAYRVFPLARRLARCGLRVHLLHQPGHGVPESDLHEDPSNELARLYFESEDAGTIVRGCASM